MYFHSFSAPWRARLYSTVTVPRNLTTSAAVYPRFAPFQRSLFAQSASI
jgi:hypothetical protein